MSSLSAVLEVFIEERTPLSLGYIAHNLQISPQKAESMLQFWISKGKIAPAEDADCGSCGVKGDCPFVYKLPTSYQLVDRDSK